MMCPPGHVAEVRLARYVERGVCSGRCVNRHSPRGILAAGGLGLP